VFFNSEKKKYRAIKLYSLFGDQHGIDRRALVTSILEVFERLFHRSPDEFDIHGPYGVKKGDAVHLSAFIGRLQKVGHEKYFALEGATIASFGFKLLCNARLEEATYTELIVWYAQDEWKIDFKEVVAIVMGPLCLSSGYETVIDAGFDIRTEKKIKRGLFGGTSVEVSYQHLRWIVGANDGAIRAIYEHNIWTENQLKRAAVLSSAIRTEPIGNLFLGQKTQEIEYNKTKH
jgi:hypothetical protein